MALSFHLQLLQFQPSGKCVGQGGQLVCFSAVDVMQFAFHTFSAVC